MKEKTKRWIKRLAKICLFFLIFIFCFHACNWGEWLAIDSCLDLGGVWDYDEKRCRDDCLTWRKDLGCIQMNEEHIKLFYACAKNLPECDRERLQILYKEQCMHYQRAYTLDYGYCDFDFKPEDCGKLEGN